MSFIQCPVCESENYKSLYQLQKTDLVQCHECELVYDPSPLPEAAVEYNHQYFFNKDKRAGYSNYEAEKESHFRTFNKRLKSIEKMKRHKGVLLDIGCALGHFGFVAKARGWTTFITDVSSDAVRYAVKNYDLSGFISSPDQLAIKKEHLDCVTLFDVIEHVNEPLQLLKKIHRVLKPDGLLCLTTPNYNSFSARWMGPHWIHLKPNEHLVYFNNKNLKLALQKSGFDRIQMRPMIVSMTLGEILLRLTSLKGPQWLTSFFKGLSKGIHYLRLTKLRIYLMTGEVEVFAYKSKNKIKTNQGPMLSKLVELADLIECPRCEAQVHRHRDKLTCLSCQASYSIQEGVIDFSTYGKTARQPSPTKKSA